MQNSRRAAACRGGNRCTWGMMRRFTTTSWLPSGPSMITWFAPQSENQSRPSCQRGDSPKTTPSIRTSAAPTWSLLLADCLVSQTAPGSGTHRTPRPRRGRFLSLLLPPAGSSGQLAPAEHPARCCGRGALLSSPRRLTGAPGSAASRETQMAVVAEIGHQQAAGSGSKVRDRGRYRDPCPSACLR